MNGIHVFALYSTCASQFSNDTHQIMNAREETSNVWITLWLWLFPVTYVIHIAEEYWGGEGYPAYLLRLRGVHLSPTRFLIDQSLGLALVIAGVILARHFKWPRFLLTVLGALVLSNGITHTLTAFFHPGYGPGLVSSMIIWIPLGAFTLFRTRREMSNRRYFVALATGVAINGIVALVALRGGRLV
jgi:Protein of unknown function with HXXEE motif